MALYATDAAAIAVMDEINTVDLAGLLEHVRDGQDRRRRGYVGRRRNPEPNPLLVALVAIGGLLAVCAFWGLVAVGLVMIIF